MLDYDRQTLFLTDRVRVAAIGILHLPPCATTAIAGREGAHPDPAKKASVDEVATIRAAAERKSNLIADTHSTRRSRCKDVRILSWHPSGCQRVPCMCISVDLCLAPLSSWIRPFVVTPSKNVRTTYINMSTCVSLGLDWGVTFVMEGRGC